MDLRHALPASSQEVQCKSGDIMVSEESACVVDTAPPGEAKVVCLSGGQTRNVRRAVVNGSGVCRHTCAYHAEVMDPCLWSRLPEHLLVHVFARLPMPQIFSLGGLSNGWSATSKTSSFKRICAEAHSKTFGILGYRRSSEQFQVAAFDLKNHKWVYHELTQLPREYRKAAWHRRGAVHKEGALYSHDGGLVCFVSTKNLPILVCNPLTNEWKTLPPNDFSRKQPVMVQLVTVAETGGYRVMVVCRHGGIRVPDIKSSPGVSISETAEAYDSKTGLWSTMNTGYVHGLDHTEYNLPKVFDCKSKALVTLSNRSYFEGTLLMDSTIVRNRVFALHDSPIGPDSDSDSDSDSDLNSVYEISEFAGQPGNPGILMKLSRYKSTLGSESNTYSVLLHACDGFIVLVADNGEENSGEYHHQLVRLFDISRHEWHKLPALNDVYTVENTANHFMCELRWDAFP